MEVTLKIDVTITCRACNEAIAPVSVLSVGPKMLVVNAYCDNCGGGVSNTYEYERYNYRDPAGKECQPNKEDTE
jgi:hypothetical protein